MKSESDIEAEIVELEKRLKGTPCPCGCEDTDRLVTEWLIKKLNWVLGR